jgi:hypothetical protein
MMRLSIQSAVFLFQEERMSDETTVASQSPLPIRSAWPAVGRCAATTAVLLARRRIHLPTEHVGMRLRFADGTSSWVYRETVVDRTTTADPCVLVVEFRLRAVRGRGHAYFRPLSLLNTPLFVGFPGFVSKLWLAHDETGVYRGLYEWDGPDLAVAYARSLWRPLALVSVPGTIRYEVMPGLRRDDLLSVPTMAGRIFGGDTVDDAGWSRVVAVGLGPAGSLS